MEIYIVRHGETLWNREKRLQGSADIALSSYGRELAIETGKQLSDISFDRVFSSPLKRAYETACLIRPMQAEEIITDDRLRELNFGVYEGRTMQELKEDPAGYFQYFFDAPEKYRAPEQGESLETLCLRAADFLTTAIEPLAAVCNRIMIVAHGAINKALMMHVKGQPMKDFWAGNLQRNCNVIILEYSEKGYVILDESHLFYDLDWARARKKELSQKEAIS